MYTRRQRPRALPARLECVQTCWQIHFSSRNIIIFSLPRTMPRVAKKKVRLQPHEKMLLQQGALQDISHEGSTSTWLCAPSSSGGEVAEKEEAYRQRTLCYRHVADPELEVLLRTGRLPSTQPYQTLTRGEEGRAYCESYLRSNKTVDTDPTTVVEFNCSTALVERLYSIQSKIEDGTISHGLGHKAGRTLDLFNESLAQGDTTWRIVLVKRRRG